MNEKGDSGAQKVGRTFRYSIAVFMRGLSDSDTPELTPTIPNNCDDFRPETGAVALCLRREG